MSPEGFHVVCRGADGAFVYAHGGTGKNDAYPAYSREAAEKYIASNKLDMVKEGQTLIVEPLGDVPYVR